MSAMPGKRSEFLVPESLRALRDAISEETTIFTIAQSLPNRISSIKERGVAVETERSVTRHQPRLTGPRLDAEHRVATPQGAPTMTNADALNELNAKRSAAVCALLAQLPEVDIRMAPPITRALRARQP